MADEVVVDGFLRNDQEMVTGTIGEFKGKWMVHIRVFVPSAAEPGEWIRTERGIAVPIDQFPQVRDGVKKLASVVGSNVVVARIPRREREEVRIGVQQFKGNLYVYLRLYFQPGGSTEWIPTKKGVNLHTGLLEDLSGLVGRIEAEIRKRNME